MKIMLDMCGLRAWQRWLFIAAFSIVFSWAMTGPGIADHVEINDFAPEQEEPLDPDAADPQPTDGELAAGLAVSYWKIFVRDIKEIADLVGRLEIIPAGLGDFDIGPIGHLVAMASGSSRSSSSSISIRIPSLELATKR